jgi:hypothetical protein
VKGLVLFLWAMGCDLETWEVEIDQALQILDLAPHHGSL